MLKKSQELLLEAQEEENDLKALGKYTKAMREARLERFDDYIVPLETRGYIITPFNGTKFVIDTQIEKFGIIDFFPKANKICIRKGNKWIKPGLKWIIKNLLENE